MKILMNRKSYEKIGNRWVLEEDYGTEEISKEMYSTLSNEKWKGDRREYDYTCYGYVMVKLSNIEQSTRRYKDVRTFTFEQE